MVLIMSKHASLDALPHAAVSAQYVQTAPGDLDQASDKQRERHELLAVRIRNFGGVLRELAPGASLERNDLRLVLCRTASRTAYLRYVLRGLFGQRRTTVGIELVHSEKFLADTCRPNLA